MVGVDPLVWTPVLYLRYVLPLQVAHVFFADIFWKLLETWLDYTYLPLPNYHRQLLGRQFVQP